ncbi:MAG: hypothetical protein US50_C0039G0010 [Candidatus Nomurabacteria bacterium GW2011_GWB1_37_5]|uniref:Transglycosylase SLT domain-containing protein n=1 Tax=Candidatus Nomurabacteria bacterium GW2011_GWB1_37_5 TaxID=1618742 RepID=A0A0G0JD55_9BACT|nr:MAG: hypothetical protein US50_C0039G0010 [Candidatus Nomurabacteria bacterium GW2011_GWB1_37_5]
MKKILIFLLVLIGGIRMAFSQNEEEFNPLVFDSANSDGSFEYDVIEVTTEVFETATMFGPDTNIIVLDETADTLPNADSIIFKHLFPLTPIVAETPQIEEIMDTPRIDSLPEFDSEEPEMIQRDEFLSFFAKLTPMTEDLSYRLEERRIETSYFWVLRDARSYDGFSKIWRYRNYFEEAALKNGIPLDLFMGLHLVESYGDTAALSGSGARGVSQFMPATAKQYGLKIVRNKKGRIVRDDRLDPGKSIAASGRYLGDILHSFKHPDFMIAGYHMGEGNLGGTSKRRGIISLAVWAYKDSAVFSNSRGSSALKAEELGLNWSKIYFGARPYGKTTELYRKLRDLGDFSQTYLYSVKAGSNLLKMSKEEYENVFQRFRNKANPNQKAPYRYMAWYHPDSALYMAYEDIEKAIERKELIHFNSLKNSSVKYKIFVYKEKESEKQNFLCYGTKEIFGAIEVISYLYEKNNKAYYDPLKIFSLVQPVSLGDWDLAKEIPVMSYGRAFVLGSPSGEIAKERLNFVLRRLGDIGYLSYTPSKGMYLVVIPPNAEIKNLYINLYEELQNR